MWLSTDPLSGYNPVFEVEHYIDGQHNGGVYNSFNHNTYGYCYQNPVLLVDPNGKQTRSYTLGGYVAEQIGGNTGGIIGFIVDLPTNTFGALLRSTTLNGGEAEWLNEKAKRESAAIFSKSTSKQDDQKDSKITLYRGVYVGHPDYTNALMGIASPWNLEGHSDPEAHNGGNYKSIFTSWTYSKAVANFHANKKGEGGVVLTKSFSIKEIVDSPDNYSELEVLVPGVVTGAKVEKPSGKGSSKAY